MIELLCKAIVIGGAAKYLTELRPNERERLRLWKLGLPWIAMRPEPENRRGLTSLEMLCKLTLRQS